MTNTHHEGVAPPAAWGRLSTVQPLANGGNLDNLLV